MRRRLGFELGDACVSAEGKRFTAIEKQFAARVAQFRITENLEKHCLQALGKIFTPVDARHERNARRGGTLAENARTPKSVGPVTRQQGMADAIDGADIGLSACHGGKAVGVAAA